MSYRKGAQAERTLLKKLVEQGYACIRVAGSGRARMEQPDVVAGNKERVIAFECKRTSKRSVYIPKEEVDALKKFANAFGCEAFIAASIGRKWYFWDIFKLKETKNKNHCFSPKDGENKF